MKSSEKFEMYVRVAVRVFQSQDCRIVMMLKNFLMHGSSLTLLKEVIIAAITELIDTSPVVVCWLLENSTCLQPEVDVFTIVTQVLLDRLKSIGINYEQDFQIENNYTLKLSKTAKLALSIHSQLFNIQDPSPIADYFHKKSL